MRCSNACRISATFETPLNLLEMISAHVWYISAIENVYNTISVVQLCGFVYFMNNWWSPLFLHDDVIKWKYFPRYWPHKGQWRGALMFSLICTWTNSWANNRLAGDLRRHRDHYDVTVMEWWLAYLSHSPSLSAPLQEQKYPGTFLATSMPVSPVPGDRFKNTYELLNVRALTFSCQNKIHIFQCMGKIFCAEFQRVPLKFHTKYLALTLKGTILIQCWNSKSSWI